MKYELLEATIDLNDPEVGFSFSSDRDPLVLSFADWTNQVITFRFYTVYVFQYRIANGWKSLPEANMLEIGGSPEIQALRDDHSASSKEELHHYVISTNEDEWCEIIAQRYEVEKRKKG